MKWVELINVEYGECVVLGGANSILMVDCGSMNHKLRDGGQYTKSVFQNIKNRYEMYRDKSFLLTHYHRDHMCGLLDILEINSTYFDKLYIPYIPIDSNGNSPILEYSLLSKIFINSKTDCYQANNNCLNIFKLIGEKIGYNRMYTLKSDDEFFFDDNYYKVLNPKKSHFIYPDKLCQALENVKEILYGDVFGKEFLKLQERFIQLYNIILDAFSKSNRKSLNEIERMVENLSELQKRIDDLKFQLTTLVISDDITEILTSQTVSQLYSDAMNSISIVFHNVRKKESSYNDILMTGDVHKEIIEMLYDKFYKNYYILKAPHHGTIGAFSTVFKDLSPSHILISTGDYNENNEVCESYHAMESMKHCTNNNKCNYFKEYKSCCNSLSYCYDCQNLSMKCLANRNLQRRNDCKIYVVTPSKAGSCFCDVS